MRHRVLSVALIGVLVLCGCTDPLAVDYKSSLSREATKSVGVGETTVTPVVFKVAEKKDTVVAVASGGSGTTVVRGDLHGGDPNGGRAEGTVSPAHPSSSDPVTISVKVLTFDDLPIAGSKVTVTCRYQSLVAYELPVQTMTFTMTSNSAGKCSKTVDPTPFNGPTMVSISGTAVINGRTYRLRCSGYSVD